MKKIYILLIHFFYWMPFAVQVYSLMEVMHRHMPENPYFVVDIATVFTKLFAFYLFYFLLFPLLSKRKFPLFIGYGLMAVGIAALMGCASFYGILNIYHLNRNFDPSMKHPVFMLNWLISALHSGLAACFVRGCITWYAEIRYKKELERKNLETELALLKAQLNPHFLFNTLNNIDILIEKDPEKASAYLKKLSDMIRFMLYESSSGTISLELEIKYIEQYIALQRIRTLTADFISFNVKGDTAGLQVAPMLFIPFIENAFKHTTNKKNSNAVTIEIAVHENQVRFNCSNIIEPAVISPKADGGLGLELIGNRLELLYKDRYKLVIIQKDDRFSVTLTLDLNEDELHHS